jgi:hypothetical protein
VKANATGLPPRAPAAAPAPAEAVTALYRAHALGLIRLAVVMLGDRGAAEDAVQEAFCGLYRRWYSLSDSTGFPEFSVATGRLARITGQWSTSRLNERGPSALDLLWSGAW